MPFLLSMLSFGKTALNTIGAWLSRRSLAEIACIGLALFCAVLVMDRNHWKHVAVERQAQLAQCRDASAKTIANYRAAAEAAAKADAANKARVEAEQKAINERTAHDYEARIAAARAAADRLRAQLAAAHPGSAPAAPVPSVQPPSGRPAQAPGDHGLSIDERLIATEQAIQLDELIKWVRKQAGIEVSK